MSEVEAQTAYVALGSNLGDRDALLRRATQALAAESGVEVLFASRVFETTAVGPAPQQDYLNAVLRLRSELSPRELLGRMLAIERACGRTRVAETRWGPRCIDLDLLLFANRCIDEPGLTVPHPRLHERSFVLQPLCDLAAAEVHPRLGIAYELLSKRVREPGSVREWHCPSLIAGGGAGGEAKSEARGAWRSRDPRET